MSRSLHIGLNRVNPQHYDNWDGPLQACEFDAKDMRRLVRRAGINDNTVLLTGDATRTRVVDWLADASSASQSGDLVVISYSGHGGQTKDLNFDEDDNLDETWCLYDGQLLDDELKRAYAMFSAGVRILVVSDSCHSGSVHKMSRAGLDATSRAPLETADGRRVRAMPPSVAKNTYFLHEAFYESVSEAAAEEVEVAAQLVLLSGCQDNQYSYDGPFNGRFTGTLLRVWKNGSFVGDHNILHKDIVARMPPEQTPNLATLGDAASFLVQRPFKA